MRKRYRILLIAATVAALLVPVGFALSLESNDSPAAVHSSYTTIATQTVVTTPPAPATVSYSIPDHVKLFFVGSVLLALASAVRRAI